PNPLDLDALHPTIPHRYRERVPELDAAGALELFHLVEPALMRKGLPGVHILHPRLVLVTLAQELNADEQVDFPFLLGAVHELLGAPVEEDAESRLLDFRSPLFQGRMAAHGLEMLLRLVGLALGDLLVRSGCGLRIFQVSLLLLELYPLPLELRAV